MPLPVSFLRRKIYDNPNVDPTIGGFVSIELSAVNREYENNVIVGDVAVPNTFEIIAAVEEVFIM